VPFASGPNLRYVGLGLYETVGSTEYVGERDVITIPAGFSTDLASVPRIFWWFLPPTGAYEKAAVVHDEGCVELARAYREKQAPRMSARDVDGLFLRILREADDYACQVGDDAGRIPGWKRHALWIGVRWGALLNPARRVGWWRDAPVVVGTTAAAVVFLLWIVYEADQLIHAAPWGI